MTQLSKFAFSYRSAQIVSWRRPQTPTICFSRQQSCIETYQLLRRLTPQSRSLSTSEPSTIHDVSNANFVEVVMKSPQPVILDCYADWYHYYSSSSQFAMTNFFQFRCQPCKELTPRLEKAVSAKTGIRLAKMNVDLEPDIAAQLKVEVLPTLYLIYEVKSYLNRLASEGRFAIILIYWCQGKVVEKVTGSLRPEGIEALLTKACGLGTANSHSETLISAGKLLSEGKPEEAAQLYSQVILCSHFCRPRLR